MRVHRRQMRASLAAGPTEFHLADVAMDRGQTRTQIDVQRAKALASFRFRDIAFHWLTFAAAILVLLLLSGVIISLIGGAVLAFRTFGPGFFTSQVWNPVTEHFGALAPIYG